MSGFRVVTGVTRSDMLVHTVTEAVTHVYLVCTEYHIYTL